MSQQRDGLPKRVYSKHGAIYYVDKSNKWHRLGDTWNREAKEQYAKVSSETAVESSVSGLLERYLLHMSGLVGSGRISQRHLSDRRVDAARLIAALGHVPADKLRRQHVATYLRGRVDRHGKPAPVRANREVSLLSAAYKHDIQLDFNPCVGVPRNEEMPRERYVEHWERRQFAKRCCPAWLRRYLLLKYLTGLRMGDMLRLSDEAATERGLVVVIGKSRRRKVLEFRWTRALRIATGFQDRVCKKRLSVVGARLTTDSSETTQWFPVTSSGFKSAWRRAMQRWKELGHEPFREHDIRAKTASDSRTLQEASERLGHDRTSTTNKHYRRSNSKVSPLK
jgi:integrase